LGCTYHDPSWIACGPGTIFDTTLILTRTPELVPEEIAPLKEQLKQALELVEQQERAVNEELQPKTLEEVTMLEGKLTEALQHLKAQKVLLQKPK